MNNRKRKHREMVEDKRVKKKVKKILSNPEVHHKMRHGYEPIVVLTEQGTSKFGFVKKEDIEKARREILGI